MSVESKLQLVPAGQLFESARDGFIGRALDYIVDVKMTGERQLRQLIKQGGVPIFYANHEGHGDIIVMAKISEYLRRKELLEGLAIPAAMSVQTGDQGEEIKTSYDLFNKVLQRRGVEMVFVTRKSDREQYGIDRKGAIGEVRSFVEKIKKGYGIAVFPEGTVQGGRHPAGTSRENIYGMQEVQNNSLIDFYRLINNCLAHKGGFAFYVPVGVHGSFRIMESREIMVEGKEAPIKDKPKLTPYGKVIIVLSAFGISTHAIRAEVLDPFTEEQIIGDLGSGGMKDSTGFNNYAMDRINPALPLVARRHSG